MRSKVFTGKARGCQQKKDGAGKFPQASSGLRKKREKMHDSPLDILFSPALAFYQRNQKESSMIRTSATICKIETNAFGFGFFFYFSRSRGRKDC